MEQERLVGGKCVLALGHPINIWFEEKINRSWPRTKLPAHAPGITIIVSTRLTSINSSPQALLDRAVEVHRAAICRR